MLMRILPSTGHQSAATRSVLFAEHYSGTSVRPGQPMDAKISVSQLGQRPAGAEARCLRDSLTDR